VNDDAFLNAMSVVMVMASLGSLVQGVRALSGKPLLLRTRVYSVAIVLIFVVPMVAFFASLWPPNWNEVLITIVALAVMIPVLAIGVRTLGDLVVYNVSETMIRQALEEVLDEENLAHSEGGPPGLLARIYDGMYGQRQFSFLLDDLRSSVHVSLTPLGAATLRFKRKQALPNYDRLVASLNNKLQARQFDGNGCSGCLMILVSVTVLGLSVVLLWMS